MSMGDDFLRQLHATFMVEAREHVQTLSRGLLALEKDLAENEQAVIAEEVFRAAHSLKGAASAVEMVGIETICQSMEDVFEVQRRDGTVPSAQAMDVLHRALDTVEALLEVMAGTGPAVAHADLASLRKDLHQISGQSRTPPAAPRSMAAEPGHRDRMPPPTATTKTTGPVVAEGTVRVALPRLETQLLDTEELLVAKLAASQRANELHELEAWFRQWRKAWMTVEPEVRTLRQTGVAAAGLGRLLNFCDWSEAAVRTLEGQLAS